MDKEFMLKRFEVLNKEVLNKEMTLWNFIYILNKYCNDNVFSKVIELCSRLDEQIESLELKSTNQNPVQSYNLYFNEQYYVGIDVKFANNIDAILNIVKNERYNNLFITVENCVLCKFNNDTQLYEKIAGEYLFEKKETH